MYLAPSLQMATLSWKVLAEKGMRQLQDMQLKDKEKDEQLKDMQLKDKEKSILLADKDMQLKEAKKQIEKEQMEKDELMKEICYLKQLQANKKKRNEPDVPCKEELEDVKVKVNRSPSPRLHLADLDLADLDLELDAKACLDSYFDDNYKPLSPT